FAIVGQRIACTEDGLVATAQEPAQGRGGVDGGIPGETDTGRKVGPLGVVGVVADGERVVNGGLPGEGSGLEDIAAAGATNERIVSGLGEAVVEGDVGELHFPAQPVVDREVGANAPGILRVNAGLALLIALCTRSGVDVL